MLNFEYSLTPDAYVTLRDGPVDHAQDRLVHKNLLCENSSFFKAAIGGQWREKDNECIELPDDEVEVVDWYLAWLYGKNPFAHPSPCECLNDDALVQDFDTSLLLAWQFGNKILDHAFCDLIVDSYLIHSQRVNGYLLHFRNIH